MLERKTNDKWLTRLVLKTKLEFQTKSMIRSSDKDDKSKLYTERRERESGSRRSKRIKKGLEEDAGPTGSI